MKLSTNLLTYSVARCLCDSWASCWHSGAQPGIESLRLYPRFGTLMSKNGLIHQLIRIWHWSQAERTPVRVSAMFAQPPVASKLQRQFSCSNQWAGRSAYVMPRGSAGPTRAGLVKGTTRPVLLSAPQRGSRTCSWVLRATVCRESERSRVEKNSVSHTAIPRYIRNDR